ncbi:hypothetical protein ACPA9J_13475 [Pseudomonas aeruginosa]
MTIKIGTINFMGIRNVAFAVTLIPDRSSPWAPGSPRHQLRPRLHRRYCWIELTYEQPADLGKVRGQLVGAGYEDAVV